MPDNHQLFTFIYSTFMYYFQLRNTLKTVIISAINVVMIDKSSTQGVGNGGLLPPPAFYPIYSYIITTLLGTFTAVYSLGPLKYRRVDISFRLRH